MKGQWLRNSVVCVLACVLMACSDEKDRGDDYPSLVSDMALLTTDHESRVATILLDNGKVYDVSAQQLIAERPDTSYRTLAHYVLGDDGLHLHAITSVFSVLPQPIDTLLKRADITAEELSRSPVKLVSMWRSGGYVNLQLGVMTTDAGVHKFAFCQDGPGAYSLVHQRPAGDAESYTLTRYFSMPLPQGEGTVTFTLQTYDGPYTRTLY